MSVTVRLASIERGALKALRASPSVLDLLCEVRGELSDLQVIARDLAQGSKHHDLYDADPAELVSFLIHPDLAGFDCCFTSYCKLDKSWAAIHYLLTGKDPFSRDVRRAPLEWAVLGDATLEHAAPATILAPKQVSEVTRALAAVSIEILRERYDPQHLSTQEIYPGIWSDPDAWNWLADYYKQLLEFYTEAAGMGDGVICFTSV